MGLIGVRRFSSPRGFRPGYGRERVVLAKKRNKNHRPHEINAPAALHVPADVAPQPPAPLPAAPPPLEQDEVRLLREALQAERSARAALELRLRGLEEELQTARRPRPTPTSAVLTPEDLGVVTLHAMAAPAKPSADDRAFFESWVIEANMRADAELAAQTVSSAPSLIPVIAEGRPSVAESSVAQDRLLRKLTSAREALDSAEAKAAHNAAQVKKLTAELAAARAEHMRTTTRLRGLEARLAQAEGQPLAPISSPALESSRPEAAPTAGAAEHPFTDLAALPPIHPSAAAATTIDVEDALAAWGATPAAPSSPAQNVAEDFDMLLQDTPGAKSDLGEALAQWGNDLSAAPAPNIEDALAAWGTEAKTPSEPATPGLEDALAAWGAEEKSAPETATPGLEDALAAWGATGDTEAPAEPALEDALAAWGALGDAIPTPVDIAPPAAPAISHDAPSGPVDSLPQLDVEDTPEEPEDEPATSPGIAALDALTIDLPEAPAVAVAAAVEDLAPELAEEALPATDIEFLNDISVEPTPVEPVVSQETTEDGFVPEAPVELAVEDDDDGIEFIEDSLDETATAEEAADALAAELLAEHRANADTVLIDEREPTATPESEAEGIDFLDDAPAPAVIDVAQAEDNALDLDEVMPEGAHDIAFDTPVEAGPAVEAPAMRDTPDATPDAEDNARALEDALEEVYGAVEVETPVAADTSEASSDGVDEIEEIPTDDTLPDADEDDFTPEPQDATPVAGSPSEGPYESLTAAYQHHHKDDEREALLAQPTRIMEAGRQHSAPRARSVAASLESWSGFGNPPARSAAPRAAEPVVSQVEEHTLEPAEDTGGRATMVDALLRFMRPK